jgi:hypothetical protein
MTVACSFTTIAVAVSSVKRSSNVKPSSVKNRTARSRSSTARLGKIMRAISTPPSWFGVTSP